MAVTYGQGVLLRAERATVRLMCGVKLRDRKRISELTSMLRMYDDIVTWWDSRD